MFLTAVIGGGIRWGYSTRKFLGSLQAQRSREFALLPIRRERSKPHCKHVASMWSLERLAEREERTWSRREGFCCSEESMLSLVIEQLALKIQKHSL